LNGGKVSHTRAKTAFFNRVETESGQIAPQHDRSRQIGVKASRGPAAVGRDLDRFLARGGHEPAAISRSAGADGLDP